MTFHPASYADPHGRLEAVDPAAPVLRRRIYPPYAPIVGRLLASGAVQGLVARGALVPTRVAEGDLAAPSVLSHERLWPVSLPGEWLPEMLADAGLRILEVAQALLPESLTLNDATPRNCLFPGAQPVFVDFTSLVPIPSLPYWRPFDQFAREILHPLYLCSWGLTPAWRHVALARPRAGIPATEAVRLMPWLFRLAHPLRAAVMGTAARLERRPPSSVPQASGPTGGIAVRRLSRLFEYLGMELRALRRRVGRRPAGWSGYYADDVDSAVLTRKTELVGEFLRRRRPNTVLDLGTNTGRFAVMAAELGAKVVAADVDEQSLSDLYEAARSRALSVTPTVMDAACPTGGTGLAGTELAPATERFRSDVTLALGLVHHLGLRQDYTLERLAETFAAFGSTYLLLEFVGPSDPRARAMGAASHPGYTLDACRSAVGSRFGRIETIPIGGDRALVIGERT